MVKPISIYPVITGRIELAPCNVIDVDEKNWSDGKPRRPPRRNCAWDENLTGRRALAEPLFLGVASE